MLDGADAMISDILSQAVVDLDHYLTDPNFADTYTGEVRERVVRLRDEAESLRAVLDTRPVVIPPADGHSHQTRSGRKAWIAWMMSDESAATPPFFTQKDLFGRGWSKRLIRDLLGEADWTAQNPHGASFAPMLCWRQDRVLAAEKTPTFTTRVASSRRRRAA
jgi:hypothetical protein